MLFAKYVLPMSVISIIKKQNKLTLKPIFEGLNGRKWSIKLAGTV